MSDNVETNSREFWESYFGSTWDQNDGPGQSRHFMLQLMAHLPAAELAWLTTGRLDILDWGCATGEGTEVLATLLPNSRVTGLDFARPAVEEAVKRHHRAKFVWEETGSITSSFDVIVTSNCLEHFEDPLSVATAHIGHCRSLYIVLVPYREHPLHEQHFAQFREESFPAELSSFKRLGLIPFSIGNLYWPGEQVLVIYASKAYSADRSDQEADGALESLRSSLQRECETSAGLGEVAQKLRSSCDSRDELMAQVDASSSEIDRLSASLESYQSQRDSELLEARTELAARGAELSEKEVMLSEARRALEIEADQLRYLVDTLERTSRRSGRILEKLEREKKHAETAERDLKALRVSSAEELSSREEELDRLRSQVGNLSTQLGESTRLLQREETSVLRPLLRTAWREGRAVARRLPTNWQDGLRAGLAPAVRRLAPRSEQAVFYEMVRQRRKRKYSQGTANGVGEASELPRVEARLGPSTEDDASFWRSWVDPGNHLIILMFSVISWDFRFQRPQQLAKALGALGHTVYYIQPEFYNMSREPYKIEGNPEHNVYLCRLACPFPHPKIYQNLLSASQLEVIADNLSCLLKERGNGAIIRLVQHPFWTGLMRQCDEGLLVYDMMDDHSGFLGNGEWLDDEEKALLGISDLVTVSSNVLMTKAAASQAGRSKAVLLTNGADVEYFSEVLPRVENSGVVRVGYYGAISSWFDSELVEYCARRHPEWEFELVGSTFEADLGGLESLANVRFYGEQAYSRLVGFLRRWDVAMIPFKVVPLTEATNPVKAYEYLAAGKAVVASRLPELERPPLSEWVRTAAGAEEFLKALEAEVLTGRDARLAEERRGVVRGHAWSERARALEGEIHRRWGMASIIVVCYGRLPLTKACLRSLLTSTGYPDWEMIVVDNHSPDETAEWLGEIGKATSRVKPLVLDVNKGFAGGVNEGVRRASGSYVVIMNNDVVVTPGWLGRLVRHLQSREGLGLVGPVTNAIGNEAAVPLVYSGVEEMLRVSQRYTRAHFRELLEVENVAFFAVALERATWDEVGELDESYGLGYFEDDDYCRRVLEVDKTIGIAEDVFLHHELSASFNSLGSEVKQAQFESSKAVFEQKWGRWQGHKYRSRLGGPAPSKGV